MSLLESINCSNDVKKLNKKERVALCEELRNEIINVIEKNGGHLASNLGIVETIVALCYTFDFPKDKLLFDVGHQCYAYKILTGRKNGCSIIRQKEGLSGFPDRDESEYDSFIAGHAGNSVGASLGKCFARDKLNDDYYVIDIVGDGAIANGLNLEALTSSVKKPKKHIIILNDNGMSISKNTNGFYKFVSQRTLSEKYINSKNRFKRVFGNSFITRLLRRIKEFFKRLLKLNNIFENFGYKYVGVLNGNNIDEMVKVLSRVKNYANNEAVLVHLVTKKGKGFVNAEENAQDYHGVGAHMKIGQSSFSKTVGDTINELIDENKNIYAITAGMTSGTGLCAVEKNNHDNLIDVGIAEEYAVNLASGMASEGLKPIVCIYSTFLQRAYDEIFHDVCLQNLPIVFCLDRAGFVGYDGKTHQGLFDISYLSHLPNMRIYAPKNNIELSKMIKFAVANNRLAVIRYPNEVDILPDKDCNFDEKWETVCLGEDVAILAVGPRMNSLAIAVNEKLNKKATIINARVIKPLDSELLEKLKVKTIITLEENVLIGGFGSMVLDYINKNKKAIRVISYGVDDKFVFHATVKEQLNESGITEEKIIELINSL